MFPPHPLELKLVKYMLKTGILKGWIIFKNSHHVQQKWKCWLHKLGSCWMSYEALLSPVLKGTFQAIVALMAGVWVVLRDRNRSQEILDTDVWSLASEFEIITIEFCIHIMAPLSVSWMQIFLNFSVSWLSIHFASLSYVSQLRGSWENARCPEGAWTIWTHWPLGEPQSTNHPGETLAGSTGDAWVIELSWRKDCPLGVFDQLKYNNWLSCRNTHLSWSR